jgi:hypothetical protein
MSHFLSFIKEWLDCPVLAHWSHSLSVANVPKPVIQLF